jgi:hypothetical protein
MEEIRYENLLIFRVLPHLLGIRESAVGINWLRAGRPKV